MKIIKAPECKLPKITFTAFDLYPPKKISTDTFDCKKDGLEIRLSDPLIGEWFVFFYQSLIN